MKLFIYKIYYVSFLYYSKFKIETPWFSAQMLLVICLGSLTIGVLGIFNLLFPLEHFVSLTKSSKILSRLTFSLFFIFLIWRLFSYVLFKKLLVSKIEGKSPYYDFNPTKKDKILTLIYVLILFFSAIIIKGIDILLFA